VQQFSENPWKKLTNPARIWGLWVHNLTTQKHVKSCPPPQPPQNASWSKVAKRVPTWSWTQWKLVFGLTRDHRIQWSTWLRGLSTKLNDPKTPQRGRISRQGTPQRERISPQGTPQGTPQQKRKYPQECNNFQKILERSSPILQGFGDYGYTM